MGSEITDPSSAPPSQSDSPDLYPAIDLLGGRVVRLRQGDYDASTDYGGDPVDVARRFVEAGARWIHVVDLDAARTGDPVNRPVVAAVCAAVAGAAQVQTGGGVRSVDAARELAGAGVARVVMGSAAVRQPTLVSMVSDIVPVAVGLDHRAGEVAIDGWTAGSGRGLAELLAEFPSAAAFVITDISRDGMLTGPDVEGLAWAVGQVPQPVIASGGVGTLDHVRELAAIAGLGGIITGKALYEGHVTIAEALRVIAEESGR